MPIDAQDPVIAEPPARLHRGRGGVADGFRPDRHDLVGATICLLGVAVIMYAPRPV